MSKIKIEKVKCEVIANSMGYYNGRIIREGQKFTYEGVLKNGEFPLWVDKVGGKTAKVNIEASKEDDLEIV